jgi:Chalcone isomerase-like
MKKIIYSFLFLGLLTACGGENKTVEEVDHFTIEGVSLPKKLSLGQTELILNGAGVRKITFFKIFVAGLYLPKKSQNPTEIIEADEPSVFRLHAVSKAITPERLSKTIQERFEKFTKGDKNSIYQSRIDLLTDILKKDPILVGDECDIAYTPNEGIRLIKNGKDLNVLIKGLDFKKILWGNWLSETPADENLKKGLLGL